MINVSEVLTIQFLSQSSTELGIDQIEALTNNWLVFLASMNATARETGDMCTVNCRLKHSIISLHLCKESLTAVKVKTLFLLLIKY